MPSPSIRPKHESQIASLDVGRYLVAPPDLTLEQVHVYARHGERTPVSVRMSEPPASIPEHWVMCKGEKRRVVERPDGTAVEGQCLLGELTDVGKESTYAFGSALRDLYVEKLAFLPDTLKDNSLAYFRSTNVPRTVESLEGVMRGLYPPDKVVSGVLPRMLIRNGKDENLVGNSGACNRLRTLLISFAQSAASTYNRTLEPLDEKISKYIGGNPVRLDGKPRASGILDTIRACKAHRISVPSEFNEDAVIGTIEKAVVAEWFADKTEEVRRLGMGRLLDELARKMNTKVTRGNSDPLKILVHSTHDTGIAALCSTLDVFDDKWPAFTASITFELFSRVPRSQPSYLQTFLGAISPFTADVSAEHYVRMRYQNENMALPACASPGDHLPGRPEFCTFAAFQKRVRELTPRDWGAECTTVAPAMM